MGAACPRCASPVALHEGKPRVDASGTIELWHASCLAVRHARPVEPVAPSVIRHERPIEPIAIAAPPVVRHARAIEPVAIIAPSASRRRGVLAGAAAAGALVAVTFGALAVHGADAAAAAIALAAPESPGQPALAIQYETAPDLRDQFPVPTKAGESLDARYPSLAAWTHPVVASDRVLAMYSTGMFGAQRAGVRRTECHRGHCGIDLSGPIGRPIVAVADGIVIHIERSRNGRDGRSGRYVRLEHADGAQTAYMHLNAIAAGLEVGDRVMAGQQIGTLGATGIRSAAPHLHFSLEVPTRPGGKHTQYIDPAPFLARAAIATAADRRRSHKPAF